MDHQEDPWPYEDKGRPALYDRQALLALVLMTKLYRGGYETIVALAESTGLNCLRGVSNRFECGPAVPCTSYVHKIATEKLSEDYY